MTNVERELEKILGVQNLSCSFGMPPMPVGYAHLFDNVDMQCSYSEYHLKNFARFASPILKASEISYNQILHKIHPQDRVGLRRDPEYHIIPPGLFEQLITSPIRQYLGFGRYYSALIQHGKSKEKTCTVFNHDAMWAHGPTPELPKRFVGTLSYEV